MPPLRSVEALQTALAAGVRLKFVGFWGHAPAPDGRVTKSCLSQWWPAPFVVDGVTYATAEHFMMAEKARLFGDAATRARILDAAHPKQAKDLGRLVADFDEVVWERARFPLVVAGNLAKFSQHPALRDFLLRTGESVLVETSPVDRVWGIGLAADDPRVEQPAAWCGLNLLGFALMEVRARLRAG